MRLAVIWRCGPHHHFVVGDPSADVTGIFGVQARFPGLDIDLPHVVLGPVANVQRHEQVIGMFAARCDKRCGDTLPRREIADVAGFEIDREHVVVFVPLGILDIDNLLRIPRPSVERNPAAAIRGHAATLVGVAGTDPDLLHSPRIGGEPGHRFPIRRKLWLGPLRVSEQEFAGNHWCSVARRYLLDHV